MANKNSEPLHGVRIDKWLWAARFYKTRSLATDAVDGGHIQLNGSRIKPAKEVKIGDKVEISLNDQRWELCVKALSDKRGSAPIARTLYEESEASMKAREEAQAMRRLMSEPSQDIHGRPTKRDRRSLDRLSRHSS